MILRDRIKNLCACLCEMIKIQNLNFLDHVYYQHNRFSVPPIHGERGNYIYFRENEGRNSVVPKKDTVKVTGLEFAGNIRVVYVFRDLNPRGAVECLITSIMECNPCMLLTSFDNNIASVIQDELNYFRGSKNTDAETIINSIDQYHIIALDFKILDELKVYAGAGCKEKCDECVDYDFNNEFIPPWD